MSELVYICIKCVGGLLLIDYAAFLCMIAVYLNNDTKRNERIMYGLLIGEVVLVGVLIVLCKWFHKTI